MKFKLAAVAFALVMATPAFAQTSTGTSTESGTSTNDANTTDPNYLSGPDVMDFYTDKDMKTLKSADEMKTVYGAMDADKQARLKKACSENQDTRYTGFCTSVGSM